MPTTDDEIFQAARAGDEHAWADLLDTYDSLIRGIARSFRLGDADTDDAVQNTWLRLVEHAGDIRDPARLGAWLATVTRRECLQLMRGRREIIGLPPDAEPADDRAPAPENTAVQREMNTLLWGYVNRLPPTARTLLTTLNGTDAPGYAEFAREVNMPVGSIGPTRMRTLRKLRIELESDGLDRTAWR
jgi:RNA polymerase sigma factor (sigma-70 family)